MSQSYVHRQGARGAGRLKVFDDPSMKRERISILQDVMEWAHDSRAALYPPAAVRHVLAKHANVAVAGMFYSKQHVVESNISSTYV